MSCLPARSQIWVIASQLGVFLKLQQLIEQQVADAMDMPREVTDYRQPWVALAGFAVQMTRKPHSTKSRSKATRENHFFGRELVDGNGRNPVLNAGLVSIEKTMLVI